MLKKVLSVLLACTLIAALSVTAMAAGNVTVDSGLGSKFVVPNVSETKTYKLSMKGNEFTVSGYTISSGTKIAVGASGGDAYMAMTQNGQLAIDYDKQVPAKDGYIQFNNAGTYIFLTGGLTGTMFVLKVEGSASAATTTDTQKPATTNTPSKPADKNTVKVAGENRTPGEIQKHSSGGYLYTVKSGDTLYDIAKRYYGNGNLWKELQKANQKWLDETKNGTIFVGYNLILPAELGDVRVKV